MKRTPKILVTTPTGKVGGAVLRKLQISASAEISLYTRDRQSLDTSVQDTTEIMEGSMDDASKLAEAFEGVTHAFLVCPQDPTASSHRWWHEQVAVAMHKAIEAHEARPRVVLLSSAGAQIKSFGPMGALSYMEEHLGAVTRDMVCLRPGFFMENLLPFLPMVQTQGILPGAFASDHPLPFVAVQDIAKVATDWLRDDSWSGQKIAGIHGPEDLTFANISQILGDVLGREVRYQYIPPEQYGELVRQKGASAGVVTELVDTLKEWDRIRMDYREEPRNQDTTTETSVREFFEKVLLEKV